MLPGFARGGPAGSTGAGNQRVFQQNAEGGVQAGSFRSSWERMFAAMNEAADAGKETEAAQQLETAKAQHDSASTQLTDSVMRLGHSEAETALAAKDSVAGRPAPGLLTKAAKVESDAGLAGVDQAGLDLAGLDLAGLDQAGLGKKGSDQAVTKDETAGGHTGRGKASLESTALNAAQLRPEQLALGDAAAVLASQFVQPVEPVVAAKAQASGSAKLALPAESRTAAGYADAIAAAPHEALDSSGEIGSSGTATLERFSGPGDLSPALNERDWCAETSSASSGLSLAGHAGSEAHANEANAAGGAEGEATVNALGAAQADAGFGASGLNQIADQAATGDEARWKTAEHAGDSEKHGASRTGDSKIATAGSGFNAGGLNAVGGIEDRIANPGAGREAVSGQTQVPVLAARGPEGTVTGSAHSSGTHETFSALDGADSAARASWVHAGAHHAEAGFEDPSLGWVAVRAGVSGGGISATILPGSADASQALGAHMAGLNEYLAEHHTPVESLTLAAQQHAGGDAGMGQGAEQQGRQQTGEGIRPAPGDAMRGRVAETGAQVSLTGIDGSEGMRSGSGGRYISVVA